MEQDHAGREGERSCWSLGPPRPLQNQLEKPLAPAPRARRDGWTHGQGPHSTAWAPHRHPMGVYRGDPRP